MTEEKSPEFLHEMRKYCAGCSVIFNCPTGTLQFKECTSKASTLIKWRGKHIPTWEEEQASVDSDSLRTNDK